MEQEIIDDFMDDFVNSYSTATVWGRSNDTKVIMNINLDNLVRRKVEAFYRKITQEK
jgi:hypothetical protein